jgi:biopolymer transport protein ExbB
VLELLTLLMLTPMTAAGAAAAGGQAAIESTANTAEIETLWDLVVKGGVLMIPIGLCSLIALTVFVERAISLRRRRIIPAGFLDGLRQQFESNADDPGRAIEYCANDGSPVANVFAAGLKRLSGPIEWIERQISEAGQRDVLKMRRYLRVLSVIAAVAPLLGLLGTIFGMITAFKTVATTADALGKTEMLAEGIYEAMITTAAGLVVAIPALIAFHWLSAKIQKLVMEIDQMTVDFVEQRVINGSLRSERTPSRPPAATNARPREPVASPAAVDGEIDGAVVVT